MKESLMSSKTPAKFLKTILVGTDFSVCAARAFSFAVSLAHSQGAKIYLLHVLMEPVQAFDVAAALPYPDSGVRQEWEEAARARLAREARAAEKRGIQTIAELKWGRPSDVIIRTAADVRASLVVVGTHGRSALEKLLIGSTAERVVRLSPVPVLTVREKR
jgi:nucleotide-binding universal stress UspA family protein